MNWAVNSLGFVAAALTTGSWIPQAIKTIRSGHAGDFSWGYLIAFATGVACWAVYGFFRKDAAVIAANVVTFALLVPILWIKARGK